MPTRDLAHVKFAQCGRHLHSLAVFSIERIDSLLQKWDVVRSINGTSNQDMVAMAVRLDRVTVKLERHSDRGVPADAEALWPRCWIRQARRVSSVAHAQMECGAAWTTFGFRNRRPAVDRQGMQQVSQLWSLLQALDPRPVAGVGQRRFGKPRLWAALLRSRSHHGRGLRRAEENSRSKKQLYERAHGK